LKEQFLLDYLKDYEDITIKEFMKFAQISKNTAQNILVDFLILEIIEMKTTENDVFYSFIDKD